MINFDNIDDFPKLTPDKSIRFEAKDELKRPIIKLQPDMNIVMPNKQSLKHRTFRPYLLLTTIAAAAAIALILIVTNNKPADSPDLPAIVTVTAPVTKPETNITVETKPEQEPVIVPDKTSEKKTHIPAKKASATTIRKSAPKVVEPEPFKQDMPVDTSVNNTDIPRRENIRIEQITAAFIPLETMNKRKPVFVYKHDYQQSIAFKAINNMASAMGKLSEDVNDAKQNITQMLESFRLPNILGKLSLDRGIDKEIDEWAQNNPGIPFSVFIDYSAENKMKEIYDENGTLVRVVFITNKSLKYKSNKIYQALNY
jgi:hypothetical protein